MEAPDLLVASDEFWHTKEARSTDPSKIGERGEVKHAR